MKKDNYIKFCYTVLCVLTVVSVTFSGCSLSDTKKTQDNKTIQKADQYFNQGKIEKACIEYKKALKENPQIDGTLKGISYGAYNRGINAYNNKDYALACKNFCISFICTPPDQINPNINAETIKIIKKVDASDIFSKYYNFSCPRLIALQNQIDDMNIHMSRLEIPKIKGISLQPQQTKTIKREKGLRKKAAKSIKKNERKKATQKKSERIKEQLKKEQLKNEQLKSEQCSEIQLSFTNGKYEQVLSVLQQMNNIDCGNNTQIKAQNALKILQNAQKEFKSKKFNQAIQTYKNVLKINPQDPNVQKLIDTCYKKRAGLIDEKTSIGISLFKQKDYNKAIKIFKTVIKLDPANEKAIQFLCKSHFWCALSHLNQKDKNFDRFISEYKQAQNYNKKCNNCIKFRDQYSTKDLENHYQTGSSKIDIKNKIYHYIDHLVIVKAVSPQYKKVTSHLNRLKKHLVNFRYIIVNKLKGSNLSEKEKLEIKLQKVDNYVKLLKMIENNIK